MRLRSLFPALAFLALAACDSNGALKIAQLPVLAPAKTDSCCCKAAEAPASCPPAAAPPIAAQPTAMAPEPARVIYVPAPAVHRQHVQRRASVQRAAHVAREYGEVREYAYAGERSYDRPAPAYDGYVEVPDRRVRQGRVVSVEEQETSSERYSERSEGYRSGGRYEERGYERGGYETSGGYQSAGGYGRGCNTCGPREAAGRDRNGFLTWPGKIPALPPR